MSARFIVGDVFDVLATLPDDSVDLVFSSPPFLALRSYLPADHPDKTKEIGSEATPADFLDTLLDVVEACDRVLAPHGSLCFELGDTFAGGGNGPDDRNLGADHPANSATRWTGKRQGWPLDKSLCMIPTLFAASLAYGYNMLRPERTTPRWRIRNLVVWARPNPPVGALGDKFRPATSYLTVATKSRSRYFDLDAVREAHKETNHRPTPKPGDTETQFKRAHESRGTGGDNGRLHTTNTGNPAGAPPLDYWVIPTAPYKGSHYATFPPDLVVKPVKAMCPPGGTVLDPFAGSGTTLAVATGHGRDAIGIDIDARNADLALERVGPMFLTIEHLNAGTVA